ncbi:RIB43A-like with coiled-coils protein 2 [Sitodiplosis mosellana]|uniref:RIB43A-like with coiled-coils protein 2 n=1 Tax=Sitodiplosis mosellana TaxID=263140 RepID=UPI0024446DB9|nr:RIB43A-like with coiled-coils protein 2 [Sitodiplosis mosellana]
MDSLLAPTKEDLKSVLKCEFRQRQEQARKARIFNPRVRLIGVDKDALDQHVHEKQHQRLSKYKEELCYALEQDRQTEALNEELNKLAEEKFQAQCELNEYRSNSQRKEQTREFDLNDPEYLRKMSPLDGLDWLGEDPDNSHRIRLQREQQKSWLQQQVYEKNQMKRNMSEKQKAIEMDALCKDEQLKQTDQMERKQRQKQQADTARYNLALAREQRAKRMQNRRREEEDNLAEIMNNISSDMLTESKDTSVSSSLFGGTRINPTMYRGMTNEQIREIRLEQVRQIDEKLSKMAKMKENDERFDQTMKARTNLLEAEEHDVRRQKLQTLREQRFMNARLLQELKQKNHHLNEEVYKFKPTQEYFEQFNTTTR